MYDINRRAHMEIDIESLCQDIINYDNKKNKNWNEVFYEISNNYIDTKNVDLTNKVLIKVVSQITKMGYDILDLPFHLKKYK